MVQQLRRQMLRDRRKLLVVRTPKSLLRHTPVVSSPDDLEKGPPLHWSGALSCAGRSVLNTHVAEQKALAQQALTEPADDDQTLDGVHQARE